MATKNYDVNSICNRTILHVRQVIKLNKRVADRVEKLKYYGYLVEERHLTKYNGIGKIEHKKRLNEYLITIGQAKHHHQNQVYAVVIKQHRYVVECNIFSKEKREYKIGIGEIVTPRKYIGTQYLTSHDSRFLELHFNHAEYAKVYTNLNDAKFAARTLNEIQYNECDIEAEVKELID